MKDLVILVADKNTRFALQGALRRPQALGIRPIAFEFREHPGRDGGARTTGPDLLALERQRFAHAFLVFDFEGCGDESTSSQNVEEKLDARLHRDWGGDAKAIVIEPEVDVWMWGADTVMREQIAWPSSAGAVRDWLATQDFTVNESGKPVRPKEALERVLRHVGQPRSSSLYEKLASRLSLPRCTDPAFQRLRASLQTWFS